MAETNTAALRAQGERDARALTVTGRRRADTGRIRRAGKALARMARAVTPETPNGQWLRDNRSFACAAAAETAGAVNGLGQSYAAIPVMIFAALYLLAAAPRIKSRAQA